MCRNACQDERAAEAEHPAGICWLPWRPRRRGRSCQRDDCFQWEMRQWHAVWSKWSDQCWVYVGPTSQTWAVINQTLAQRFVSAGMIKEVWNRLLLRCDHGVTCKEQIYQTGTENPFAKWEAEFQKHSKMGYRISNTLSEMWNWIVKALIEMENSILKWKIAL